MHNPTQAQSLPVPSEGRSNGLPVFERCTHRCHYPVGCPLKLQHLPVVQSPTYSPGNLIDLPLVLGTWNGHSTFADDPVQGNLEQSDKFSSLATGTDA